MTKQQEGLIKRFTESGVRIVVREDLIGEKGNKMYDAFIRVGRQVIDRT